MEIYKFKISDYAENQINEFKNYCQEAKSTQSIVAHYFAKSIIAKKLSKNISEIEFYKNEHSKPLYDGVYFNITHSKDYVFIAFNDSPVGIDAEVIRNINPNLVKKVCAESEAISNDNFNVDFLSLYTAKEAYFKFAGTGITNFKNITVAEISKTHNLFKIKTNDLIISIVF